MTAASLANVSFDPHSRTSPRKIAGQRPGYSVQTDLTALAGQAVTTQTLAHGYQRQELIRLVHRFLADRYCGPNEGASPITQETENAAIAFIGHLPPAMENPKISPDGEGGLLLVWESRAAPPLLVLIDGWRIHMVVKAATPDAVYHDDIPFDGELIPPVVLHEIRSR